MGLPVGVTVHYPQRWGQLPSDSALRVWDGGTLRDFNEWQQIKSSYDTNVLDGLQRKLAVEGSPGKYPIWWKRTDDEFGLIGLPYYPRLWETYVRRWVYKNSHKRAHPITEQQKTTAAAILKDCQADAFPIFKRIDKQLSAHEANLTKAALTDADRKAIEARRDKLTEPITIIFNMRLKPRLENLLDEKQRAERKLLEAPTARPAIQAR